MNNPSDKLKIPIAQLKSDDVIGRPQVSMNFGRNLELYRWLVMHADNSGAPLATYVREMIEARARQLGFTGEAPADNPIDTIVEAITQLQRQVVLITNRLEAQEKRHGTTT